MNEHDTLRRSLRGLPERRIRQVLGVVTRMNMQAHANGFNIGLNVGSQPYKIEKRRRSRLTR